VTAVELRAFLQDHLAPFEIPRRIEFRSNLPRTFIGKVAKKDLVAELAARTSAATNRRADDPDRPPTRENAS
jgi:long-chain acyl-CoA synthetase